MKSLDPMKLLRWGIYALVLALLYLLETTPHLLPEVFRALPSPVLAASIAIALNGTSEVSAMGFGVACGLLLDHSRGGPYGFHGLILALVCYGIALLVRRLFQKNLLSALFLSVGTIALVYLLRWLFFYVVPGYGDAGYALLYHYLPMAGYTLVAEIPVYWIYRGLARLLKSQRVSA